MPTTYYSDGWQHTICNWQHTICIGPIDPEAIMQDTWGHLKPKDDVKHYGTMLFSYINGEWNFLDQDFELCDPWSFDDQEIFFDKDFCVEREEGFYLWEGYYIRKDATKFFCFVGDYKHVTMKSMKSLF